MFVIYMNGFHNFMFALMESLVRFVCIAFRFNKIEKHKLYLTPDESRSMTDIYACRMPHAGHIRTRNVETIHLIRSSLVVSCALRCATNRPHINSALMGARIYHGMVRFDIAFKFTRL